MKGNSSSGKKLSKSARRRLNKAAQRVGREVIDGGLLDSSIKDPRWFAEMGKSSFMGLNLGGLKMGSGMVGVAPKAYDIQRSTPKLKASRTVDGNVVDCITGTDLIATVSSGMSGNVSGDVLVTQIISPSQMNSTRLRQFSALYQRYRFKLIRFVYEPIANATQSGQLVGYADFDPDNQLLTNNPLNVQTAVSHQGQRITQIWERTEFDMAQVGSFTDLYTEISNESSDPRFSFQGIFYLIAASTLASNIPLGNIYVDYEVDFSIPFLEPSGDTLAGYSNAVYNTSYLMQTATAGGTPVTIGNLGTPGAQLFTTGNQLPVNSESDLSVLVWDSAIMGAPFQPSQKLYVQLTLAASPGYAPGTAVAFTLVPTISFVSPGSGAFITTLEQPTQALIASQTQEWGSSIGFVVNFAAEVLALAIGFKLTLTTQINSGPGNLMLSTTVTPPFLVAERNRLSALEISSRKDRRRLRDLRDLLKRSYLGPTIRDLSATGTGSGLPLFPQGRVSEVQSLTQSPPKEAAVSKETSVVETVLPYVEGSGIASVLKDGVLWSRICVAEGNLDYILGPFPLSALPHQDQQRKLLPLVRCDEDAVTSLLPLSKEVGSPSVWQSPIPCLDSSFGYHVEEEGFRYWPTAWATYIKD